MATTLAQRRRYCYVSVGLTFDERQHIEELVKRHGGTLSEFIRRGAFAIAGIPEEQASRRRGRPTGQQKPDEK